MIKIVDWDGDTLEVKRLADPRGAVYYIENTFSEKDRSVAVELSHLQLAELRDELNRILAEPEPEPGERAYEVYCECDLGSVMHYTAWSQLSDSCKTAWAAVEAEDYTTR